jgi:hypothetical protein
MNFALVAGIIVVLILLLGKRKGQEDTNKGMAILWAHKTGAGYQCVGYADYEESAIEVGHYKLSRVILIDPHFINPAMEGEPVSPGYGMSSDIYISASEMENVESGAGVYQVLMPLIASGMLTDQRLLMFLDAAAIKHMKSQDEWEAVSKAQANWSIGRTYPFRQSTLFRVRNSTSVFTSYFYPVLLEMQS